MHLGIVEHGFNAAAQSKRKGHQPHVFNDVADVSSDVAVAPVAVPAQHVTKMRWGKSVKYLVPVRCRLLATKKTQEAGRGYGSSE